MAASRYPFPSARYPLPPAGDSDPVASPGPVARGPIPSRRIVALLSALLLAVLTVTGAPGALAKDPPVGLGGFTPGTLISDQVMFNGTRMSAAQIDAFLDIRGKDCRSTTAAACLKDYRSDTPQRAKTAYCGAIAARTAASAGQILADVSVACTINPQVLLVMLQKEQGLITTTAPSTQKLEQALGFQCPDFAGCDPAFAGFVNQVYSAASRLQEYGDPARGFTYRAGGTYAVPYSPYAFCGTGTVKIANRATAALYNYTPFTPTQTVLDAGQAAVSDDVCATYGNRNFFRNFSQWFGSPNGAATSRYPVAAPLASAPAAPFKDVRYGQVIFFTEIAWMKHTGLSNGWPDGTFRPYEPIKRDAMAAFMYRAAGSPSFTPPEKSPFKDIDARTTIFYKEITWAHAVGITTGWPDGTFRPYEPIKRDAVAAFLYRAAGSPAYTPPARSPFTDVNPRTVIFHKEISWAYSEGITTGWLNGTFQPYAPVKRDAVAAFIYRQQLD